jgi:hypothetical protein
MGESNYSVTVNKKTPAVPIPIILGIKPLGVVFAFTSTRLANTDNGD